MNKHAVFAVLVVAVAVAQEPHRAPGAFALSRSTSRNSVPEFQRRSTLRGAAQGNTNFKKNARLQAAGQKTETQNTATAGRTAVQDLQLPNVVQEDPVVYIEEQPIVVRPQLGQEFVSFLSGGINQTKTSMPSEKEKPVIDPQTGETLLSASSINTSFNKKMKDSVISAKNGQIFFINIDNTNKAYDNDHSVTESLILPEDSTSTALNQQYSVLDVFSDTQSSNYGNNPPPVNVNGLYGKYFKETDLNTEKGFSDNDKELVPAESKVRSKFEIKEVNGQLYEYEYRYYYDDEVPEYDYDVVGNIPDEANSSSTITTTSTAAPTNFSRNQERTEGKVFNAELKNTEEQAQSSRGRTRNRGQAVQPDSPSHAAVFGENEVGESRLPTNTRFPPRTVGVTQVPESRSILERTAGKVQQTIFTSKEKTFQIPTEVVLADDVATTPTLATRSLMNLYALSQVAGAEDAESSTVFNDGLDTRTVISSDYLDNYYDYDYGTSESPLASDNFEQTTTVRSTTSSTTTTPAPNTPIQSTTLHRTRSRSNFRNDIGVHKSRFASKTKTTQNDIGSISEGPVSSTTISSRSLLRGGSQSSSIRLSSSRFSNRFRPSLPPNVSNMDTSSNINSHSPTKNKTSDDENKERTINNLQRNNKFRPSASFRSKTGETSTTTAKPLLNAKTVSTSNFRSRSRLFSRLQQGRQEEAENKEVTNAEEHGIEIHEGMENESTTTTTASPRFSRRRDSFDRTRLNRGPHRNSRLNVDEEKKPVAPNAHGGEADIISEARSADKKRDDSVQELQTTTSRPNPTPSPRSRSSSRLSERFNSRSRGRGRVEVTTSTTIPPNETPREETVDSTKETNNSTALVDHTHDVESSVSEGKSEIPEETSGRKSPRRGGVFGRFRNKPLQAETQKPATTATTKPAVRKSSFSLFNNRRRPSRTREQQPEEMKEEPPSQLEEVAPLTDEAIDNELVARGPQVELEAQASDFISIAENLGADSDGGNQVLTEELSLNEEAEELLHMKSEKKKPGLSLLSRLRNRNRNSRSN